MTGKATSGVGSTVDSGVVAKWQWYNGLEKSPTESILKRGDVAMLIRNCLKDNSAFLRNTGNVDNMLFYDYQNDTFETVERNSSSTSYTINVQMKNTNKPIFIACS